MASTGFWPVKSRLKDVIDYAENPDKTIDKRFLDDDLWAALSYAENGRKTDQKSPAARNHRWRRDRYATQQGYAT